MQSLLSDQGVYTAADVDGRLAGGTYADYVAVRRAER